MSESQIALAIFYAIISCAFIMWLFVLSTLIDHFEVRKDRKRVQREFAELKRREKLPVLFYWEEAINGWTPCPHLVDDFISADMEDPEEVFTIEFQYFMMSEEDLEKLPIV